MKRASILVIDHTEHNNFKERLGKWPNFEVIGETNSVDIGFTLAERHQPDVILLNVDLTGPEDNSLAEVFAVECPASSLILMTSSDSRRVLRQALWAGAKEVINLPIDDDKLFFLIGKVVKQQSKRREIVSIQKKERPQFKIITVFSTKGGVGKTTVALSLAVAIRKFTQKRTVLVDLNLTAGNAALMAGINSRLTFKDLVDEISNLDQEGLDSYCIEHSSGVRILPAPANSEFAGFIKAEHVEKALERISETFNYVIVDAPNYFDDNVMTALERAEDIVLVTTLDMASIYNLKQCLELLGGLNMRTKARVIVNKMGYSGGIKIRDLEEQLATEVQCVIPNCEKQAVNAVNLGVPLMLSAKDSAIVRPFEELAQKIVGENDRSRQFVKRRLFSR